MPRWAYLNLRGKNADQFGFHKGHGEFFCQDADLFSQKTRPVQTEKHPQTEQGAAPLLAASPQMEQQRFRRAEKGLLPLEKLGFRIGHEQRVMDQGNDGNAEQQRKGANQQLPEIVCREVRKIAYGQPRQHEGLFGEILFLARKRECDEKSRFSKNLQPFG